MIVSFRHKGLEKYYSTGSKSGITPQHEKRLRAILARLDVATSAEDMNLPGLALHKLSGSLDGFCLYLFPVIGESFSGWKKATSLMLITWIITERCKMAMFNPPHPGETIKELCLEPLGLSVTKAAEGLGVTRKAFSELINGKSGISPLMAIRLSRAFGGTPESWLKQQMMYDLWKAEKEADKLDVKDFKNAI